MFSQFQNSLLSLVRSFALAFQKVFSFVFSPGVLFAQILFYGPKAVFHAKASKHKEAIRSSQTFIRTTLLGRFLLRPLLLTALTAAELLLKVVSLIFWPILFVVSKFERLVPRNGDICTLTPEMRYHMWLMRRTFWH